MPNHHEKDLTAVLVQGDRRPKAAPVGHSSRGVQDCQADCAVSIRRLTSALDEVGRGGSLRRGPPFEPAMKEDRYRCRRRYRP